MALYIQYIKTVIVREIEEFDVPVLNMVPVGKDAHQWTERLDVNYAFETLLDMLPKCIEKLLVSNKITQA
ncbi:hypothetical protein ACQVPW_21505 [Bacillus cereus]|uniref:hypothetical protein n=1 Tax=Bacillus cereus TaxID=1396 RepID=UPI003D65EF85